VGCLLDYLRAHAPLAYADTPRVTLAAIHRRLEHHHQGEATHHLVAEGHRHQHMAPQRERHHQVGAIHHLEAGADLLQDSIHHNKEHLDNIHHNKVRLVSQVQMASILPDKGLLPDKKETERKEKEMRRAMEKKPQQARGRAERSAHYLQEVPCQLRLALVVLRSTSCFAESQRKQIWEATRQAN